MSETNTTIPLLAIMRQHRKAVGEALGKELERMNKEVERIKAEMIVLWDVRAELYRDADRKSDDL